MLVKTGEFLHKLYQTEQSILDVNHGKRDNKK